MLEILLKNKRKNFSIALTFTPPPPGPSVDMAPTCTYICCGQYAFQLNAVTHVSFQLLMDLYVVWSCDWHFEGWAARTSSSRPRRLDHSQRRGFGDIIQYNHQSGFLKELIISRGTASSRVIRMLTAALVYLGLPVNCPTVKASQKTQGPDNSRW